MTTSSTKRTYRLVNAYGAIYRMTERNYRRYLNASVKALRVKNTTAESADPSKYGTEIGVIAFTATDAKLDEFEFAQDYESMLIPSKEPTP